MTGYPGDPDQAHRDLPAERPRRSIFPWIITLVVATFALGLIANPWFEREVRARLPFGAQPATHPTAVDRVQDAEAETVSRRVQMLEQNPAAAAGEKQIAEMHSQADRLDALEKRFDTLDSRNTRALSNAARAEGMLLALAARRAIDTGQPLGVIEGMLRERFGGTQPQAVAALISAGQKPVTLSQLQAGLQTLEPQLQQAARGGGWWSDFKSDLAGLILFKRESEPIVEPIEQLKDARQRLMVGDVGGALWQVNRLPDNARAKAQTWIIAARRYLAARQALDTLETVALLSPPPGEEEQVIPLPAPAPPPTATTNPAPTAPTPRG